MNPTRERLPDERTGVHHKARVGGQKFYLTLNKYPDGRPGEVFLRMAKPEPGADVLKIVAQLDESIPWATPAGREAMISARAVFMGSEDKIWSMMTGLADAWAITVSMLLQYGVPLRMVVEKFRAGRFEPSGRTRHEVIHTATSVLDYASRWMLLECDPEAYAVLYPPLLDEHEVPVRALGAVRELPVHIATVFDGRAEALCGVNINGGGILDGTRERTHANCVNCREVDAVRVAEEARGASDGI